MDVIETQIIQYSMCLGDDWKILRISNNYFLNNEEKSKALYRIVPFHSVFSLFRACFRLMLGLRPISDCSKTNYATLFILCKKKHSISSCFAVYRMCLSVFEKRLFNICRRQIKMGYPVYCVESINFKDISLL